MFRDLFIKVVFGPRLVAFHEHVLRVLQLQGLLIIISAANLLQVL